MALQPGDVIEGKYRIVRTLGEGGMGAVYEGENTRIKRRVAIKVLHAEVAEKTDVVQRFEREAQAAGRIGSEHIVEVLDLGNLPTGERFMVMEYLDGEDLTARIKRQGLLPPAEAAPIICQVLQGLAAAHQAGIIHRDLKPDNIYVLRSKAGRADFVKILDFGVSKFSFLDGDMSMTRTGAVMGTPYYMSPEQAKGGTVDTRSDLYAVGVVLYQTVTGRLPFNAGSFNELLFKIALETPDPVEKLVPSIQSSFASIISRAMQRDPEARFQTAQQFEEALSQWQLVAPPAEHGSSTMALPVVDPAVVAARSAAGAAPPTTPSSAASAPGLSSASHGGHATPYPTPATGSLGTGTGTGTVLAAPVPATTGIVTPPHGTLGQSQVGVAMTPRQSRHGATTAIAVAAAAIIIVGLGGLGAWLVMAPKGGETTPTVASGPPPDESATATTSEEQPLATQTSAAGGQGGAEPAASASAVASTEPTTTEEATTSDARPRTTTRGPTTAPRTTSTTTPPRTTPRTTAPRTRSTGRRIETTL